MCKNTFHIVRTLALLFTLSVMSNAGVMAQGRYDKGDCRGPYSSLYGLKAVKTARSAKALLDIHNSIVAIPGYLRAYYLNYDAGSASADTMVTSSPDNRVPVQDKCTNSFDAKVKRRTENKIHQEACLIRPTEFIFFNNQPIHLAGELLKPGLSVIAVLSCRL